MERKLEVDEKLLVEIAAYLERQPIKMALHIYMPLVTILRQNKIVEKLAEVEK